MAKLSANEAKARFGELLDRARQEPITIEKHGRPVAVVISSEEFDRLQALKLEKLRTEVQFGLDAIANGDYVDLDDEGIQHLMTDVKAKGREAAKK